ncbi:MULTISPECIES: hypothetical protein [Bacillus subtilis group]|uniref:hypothetical protein n=1 Tax=Bacillus subtilis group TaxID=653685 RepID=UPI002281F023|nr:MULTISPECIES: hypothetical protein [Bacillus subtilis group]MCY8798227.1 hypothetical protein [Bacillus inaquosorum]MCY9273541.1 hypothetical protein [Bacillus inaquosorum]MEC0772979.1 hypothetical protein [Bacillus inaquosorum]MEC0796972.1 hypothetical protein [Bacillus inaquosorum]MEC1404200.1 hypothetical protein [Bacillus subtilis]
MQSGVCLVPIRNLSIESVFKIDDIIFSPTYTKDDVKDLSYTDTVTKDEFEEIQNYIKGLKSSIYSSLENTVVAIIKDDKIKCANVQEASMFINNVCEKIDRSLDYFRLSYCRIGLYETLPSLPGIIDGFKSVYIFDNNSQKYKLIVGDEISILYQKGIGLQISIDPSKRDLNNIDSKCIFSKRTDEVFINCRTALTRVNEAMYMTNLNAAFIYLMSTIEMLADRNKYLQFSKVKSKILPFLAEDKKQYHELSKFTKHLSKDIREQVVHNGKNIYELYTYKEQVERELFRLTGLIVNYVRKVISLDIYTFKELEEKRKELKYSLGI